jgi:hypothetical protein
MGIGSEQDLSEPIDPRLLVWPKNLLVGLYLAMVLWSAVLLYSKPMYDEEYIIRLLYMIILLPLIGFIAASHRWAMSSACAVFICYIVAMFLFSGGSITIGLGLFTSFLVALTWRSIMACDQLDIIRSAPPVDVFE